MPTPSVTDDDLAGIADRVAAARAIAKPPWMPFLETREAIGGGSYIRVNGDATRDDEVYVDLWIGNEKVHGPDARLDDLIDFLGHSLGDIERLLAEVKRLRGLVTDPGALPRRQLRQHKAKKRPGPVTDVVLEWWPDSGSDNPLWVRTGPGGVLAELADLPLNSALVEPLRAWGSRYAEDRLPLEGDGDQVWLDEGVNLARGRPARAGHWPPGSGDRAMVGRRSNRLTVHKTIYIYDESVKTPRGRPI